MKAFVSKILIILRRLYKRFLKIKTYDGVTYDFAQYKNQEASDVIKECILTGKPIMISRFGSGELNYYINSLIVNKWHIKKYLYFICGKINYFNWNQTVINQMVQLADFKPHNNKTAKNYQSMTSLDIKDIDILGSWLEVEKLIENELRNTIKIRLPDLEPYMHNNPWSEALRGKKVLVINPLEKTIQSQYKNRQLLFNDERVLPDFTLITLKSIYLLGSDSPYESWFHALEYMKNQINVIDFDIAIIGCGAYGMPLAAYVKRLGKQSIHLGGATQLLFGIRGKRWESIPEIASLMNEYWVRPLPEETPINYAMVEDGCYW